jgi:uncharacterized protein YchJ
VILYKALDDRLEAAGQDAYFLDQEKWEHDEDESEEVSAAPSTPAKSAKTGRNDPCPCGSGKKFKKCCGA